jgi:hypothetical protein
VLEIIGSESPCVILDLCTTGGAEVLANRRKSKWQARAARSLATRAIVPGFGLPAVTATLTPPSVPIIPGAPSWLPLGGSSGDCFGPGCGFTGWVLSNFTIANSGAYNLTFGVTNFSDTAFQSGMAFDGITVAGVPVQEPPIAVPGPLAGAGLPALAALGGLAWWRRRRPAGAPQAA